MKGELLMPQKRAAGADVLLFSRNFLRHPRMLGSLIPSSRFLVRRVLDEIDWSRARVIVEYGPGVGTLTGEMLRRMGPEGRLVAIEMNGDFVRFLRRSYPDERLRVLHGSAAEADELLRCEGMERADYVVSGIPHATIAPALRERILGRTRDLLEPDGAFLVYQFTRAVLPYLRRHFGEVRQEFEPLNVMPARLFFCRRPKPAAVPV